ncbi:Na+-driven multidrug efflux pump [Catenulispora sp. EB89]|uniref:MATE family efflux transporter n=1 Tax=Catenulispora sp. EB89 TaxID=3156257 RepID=UPI003513CD25
MSIGTAGHRRAIVALAWPVYVELLAGVVAGIIDVAWVAHLGPAPTAAVALATNLENLVLGLVYIAGAGTTMLVAARATAEGRRAAIRGGAALSAVITTAVVGAGLAFRGQVVGLFFGTGEGDARRAALGYLAISIPGLAVYFGQIMVDAVFKGLGDTRTPMRLAMGANALILVLDPTLIYGLGLGVRGAAIATVTGRAAMLAVAAVVVRRRVVESQPAQNPTTMPARTLPNSDIASSANGAAPTAAPVTKRAQVTLREAADPVLATSAKAPLASGLASSADKLPQVALLEVAAATSAKAPQATDVASSAAELPQVALLETTAPTSAKAPQATDVASSADKLPQVALLETAAPTSTKTPLATDVAGSAGKLRPVVLLEAVDRESASPLGSPAIALSQLSASALPRPATLRDLAYSALEVARAGAPLGTDFIVRMAGATALAGVVATFGVAAVAAYGIGTKAMYFASMAFYAVRQAATIHSARSAPDRRIGSAVLGVGAVLGLGAAVVYAAAAPWIMAAFTARPDVAAVGVVFLRWLALYLVPTSVVIGLSGVLAAGRGGRRLLPVTVFGTVLAVVLAHVLSGPFSLAGVWAAMASSAALQCAALLVLLRGAVSAGKRP